MPWWEAFRCAANSTGAGACDLVFDNTMMYSGGESVTQEIALASGVTNIRIVEAEYQYSYSHSCCCKIMNIIPIFYFQILILFVFMYFHFCAFLLFKRIPK